MELIKDLYDGCQVEVIQVLIFHGVVFGGPIYLSLQKHFVSIGFVFFLNWEIISICVVNILYPNEGQIKSDFAC